MYPSTNDDAQLSFREGFTDHGPLGDVGGNSRFGFHSRHAVTDDNASHYHNRICTIAVILRRQRFMKAVMVYDRISCRFDLVGI